MENNCRTFKVFGAIEKQQSVIFNRFVVLCFHLAVCWIIAARFFLGISYSFKQLKAMYSDFQLHHKIPYDSYYTVYTQLVNLHSNGKNHHIRPSCADLVSVSYFKSKLSFSFEEKRLHFSFIHLTKQQPYITKLQVLLINFKCTWNEMPIDLTFTSTSNLNKNECSIIIAIIFDISIIQYHQRCE